VAENRGVTDEHEVISELSQAADAPVQLSVAARSDRLPILRSMVERTLFIDDWSVDDVADVNLGIDEICAQIITLSAPESRLSVALTVGPRGIIVHIDGMIHRGLDLDTSGFGWRVVETVTDVQSIVHVDAGEHRRVTVLLAKHRA
jgi:serine/threonine-protein kinase RsbW